MNVDPTRVRWFKSSYSSGGDGDCVEVALTPATVHIRDSKTPDAAHLTIDPTTWANFLTHVSTR